MKEHEITVFDYYDDENGRHITEHTEKRVFTDAENRDDDLCTFCGFPEYPKCKEWCQSYNWDKNGA